MKRVASLLAIIWVAYFCFVVLIINKDKDYKQKKKEEKRLRELNATIKSMVNKEIKIPDSLKKKK